MINHQFFCKVLSWREGEGVGEKFVYKKEACTIFSLQIKVININFIIHLHNTLIQKRKEINFLR